MRSFPSDRVFEERTNALQASRSGWLSCFAGEGDRAVRSSSQSHRTRVAFTLIEVVVGMTLMATVLVGSLLSFSAHRKQLRVAERKLEAVAVADGLVYQLAGRRDGMPPAERGLIAGYPQWFWQTNRVGVAQPLGLPVQLIRFRVIEVLPDGSPLTLVSVDVVERLP